MTKRFIIGVDSDQGVVEALEQELLNGALPAVIN